MAIIVEAYFDVWGSNGRYCEGGLVQYEDVEEAIYELGMTAFHNAVNERIEFKRTIPDGHLEEIKEGVAKYVAKRRHEHLISKVKEQIQISTNWLETVNAKTESHMRSLEENRAKLAELEKDNEPV